MAARGYTTTLAINDYLGGDLTQEQLNVAEDLIEPAEEWLRQTYGVDYLPGAIASELYRDIRTPHLFLRHAPIAAITALSYRTTLDAADTAMVADRDYELMDATLGWVRLIIPCPAPGWPIARLTASYTTPATVPAAARLATTIRVADTMRPAGGDLPAGVESVDFGELKIKLSSEPSKQARADIDELMGSRRARWVA